MESPVLLANWAWYILTIAWLAAYLGYFAARWAVVVFIYWRYKNRRTIFSMENLPPVTIVKPLCGFQKNLYVNLKSYFEQNYPQFEIVFACEDSSDPAIPVATQLAQEFYPKVPVTFAVGGAPLGLNPKVTNLNRGFSNGKYELVLLSDAGLHVHPDMLVDLVSKLRGKVRCAFSVIAAAPITNTSNYANVQLRTYLGTQFNLQMWGTVLLGQLGASGANILLHRSDINGIGGMKFFANDLGEDNVIVSSFNHRGHKTDVGDIYAKSNQADYTSAAHHNRMMRWAYVRTHTNPFLVLFEFQGECCTCGAIAVITMYKLFGFDPFIVLLGTFDKIDPTYVCRPSNEEHSLDSDDIDGPAVHYLLWFVCDYLSVISQNEWKLEFSRLTYLLAWLHRDLVSIPLLIETYLAKYVVWHGNRIYGNYKGMIYKVEKHQQTLPIFAWPKRT